MVCGGVLSPVRQKIENVYLDHEVTSGDQAGPGYPPVPGN